MISTECNEGFLEWIEYIIGWIILKQPRTSSMKRIVWSFVMIILSPVIVKSCMDHFEAIQIIIQV